MAASYCWRFRLESTVNKHLPADLKEHAHIVTWRVVEMAIGTYGLVGFIQFTRAWFKDELPKLNFPAEFTPTDLRDFYANFNPLVGGYVITWGSIVHILQKPPIRLKKRARHPPRSVEQLRKAAQAPNQTRISLSKLAAAEMGLDASAIPDPS